MTKKAHTSPPGGFRYQADRLPRDCNFRFRRKISATWEHYSLIVEPRSMYVLRDASRTAWEHSIPGVEALRYSITFRSLR